MDKQYLLLFNIENSGDDFSWFDTEDELREYVSSCGSYIKVIDAIHIISCETINFELEEGT